MNDRKLFMITRDLSLELYRKKHIMKLYKFNAVASTQIPSTKTVVSFVRAMIKMQREGQEMFTALEVINYALHHGLWSTTQLTDEKRMTTWAFYVKTLKSIGLEECGETSMGSKKVLTIDDLLGEFEDEPNDDAERELEDEDMEKSCDEDEELERMIEEEAKLQAAE
jgi:hypothetical protein